MIIICNNCNKKFSVDSNLIPDKGRLLQCAACNHKWYFKKEIIEKVIGTVNDDKNDELNIFEQNKSTTNKKINPSDFLEKRPEITAEEELEKKIEINTIDETSNKIGDNINENTTVKDKPKKQRNYKILNISIVTIISFAAFIIIVDTFKYPIGKIVPNVEFILYNLYESIKDISLFIKDLT